MISFLKLLSLASVSACLLLATTANVLTKEREPLNYEFVEGAGGVPLAVVEGGESGGQPILFVHGFSFSSHAWTHQLSDESLRNYRLVGFDLRGHGASGKPWTDESYAGWSPWAEDIKRIIDAKGLTSPVLVGWSMGGLMIMNFVREYGFEDVGGIVLVGTTAGLNYTNSAPTTSTEFDDAALRKQMSLDIRENVEGSRAFVRWITAQPMSGDDEEIFLKSTLQLPVYVKQAMRNMHRDNTDLVSVLRRPLLFIAGDKDSSAPPNDIERLVGQLPSARFSLFRDVGHAPFLEESKRFNAELIQFVDEVAAEERASGSN